MRKVGSRRNGTWTMEIKYSLNRMAEMDPRAHDFTSSARMTAKETFTHVIYTLVDWLISLTPFIAHVVVESSLWQSHIMKI